MKNKLATLFLIILSLLIIANTAFADIGPKPTADIHVILNEKGVPDESFSAKMLSCSYEMKYEKLLTELKPYAPRPKGDAPDLWYDNCAELSPKYGFKRNICYSDLQVYREKSSPGESKCEKSDENDICKKIKEMPDNEKGCYWTIASMAWGGDCKDSNCEFGYYLPSDFKLAIYLPSQDKIYISEEITRKNFRSSFEANLFTDGTMSLKDTTPFLQSNSAKNILNFFIALILTLFLELMVALIYVYKTGIPKKILKSVLFGSVISLPIVWFVFPLIKIAALVIILGEIFAFIFEAYFIHWRNKKIITLKKSFILSILMNSVSLAIGGLIFYI